MIRGNSICCSVPRATVGPREEEPREDEFREDELRDKADRAAECRMDGRFFTRSPSSNKAFVGPNI